MFYELFLKKLKLYFSLEGNLKSIKTVNIILYNKSRN